MPTEGIPAADTTPLRDYYLAVPRSYWLVATACSLQEADTPLSTVRRSRLSGGV